MGDGPLVCGGLVLALEERQGRRMSECYKARERVSGLKVVHTGVGFDSQAYFGIGALPRVL